MYHFRLIYTDATLAEIQRCANLVPGGIGHKATSDMVIKGYKVPKGTLLIGVLGHVLADPRYWENPDEFKPERFIAEDGSFKKHEQFVPFGIGMEFL